MDFPELTFAFGIRATMVLLGLGAMLYLWRAHRDRRHLWDKKMFKIWRAQMVASIAVVQGNFEFVLREDNPTPTVGFYLFMLFLVLVIDGARDDTPYLKEQEKT